MNKIFSTLILVLISYLGIGQIEHSHQHDGKTIVHAHPIKTNYDSVPRLTILPLDGPTPWTNLDLNNDPDKFHFAIVTDRTGGHQPGVFMDAINKLNLLQPEFVMSVGDLIEGYTTDLDELNRQWNEFDGFVKKLEMPFFYIPGNHDITNQVMEDLWQKKFGPTYYHFVNKDILFLALNSEDQKRGAGRGTISDEQFEYIQRTFAENQDVSWTLLFMHQPLWNQKDTKRWNEVEALLKNRKHTVFTGHEHRYVKYERNKGNYFILATTGGQSPLRGPGLGEFDHVVWVTMTHEGPIIANLLLDGIWDENVFTEHARMFVEKMNRRTPFLISPFYFESKEFDEGQVSIKITNDENVPMKVEFDETFSADLIGILEKNYIVVPPNSVEIISLQLQKRKEKFDLPMTVSAKAMYQPEDKISSIEIPFTFNLKPLPKLQLKPAEKKIEIDGHPDDWSEFPFAYKAASGDMDTRFNFLYDDEYVYFGAKVVDDTVEVNNNHAIWLQDNIGFGFNALPIAKSAMSTGRRWFANEFMQMVTPETKSEKSKFYRPNMEGAEVKCVTTGYGYFAEAKIPVTYIKEKQGKNWKNLRLQVLVDDKDGEHIRRYWWQPNWRKKEKNIIGSGMFFKD